MSMGARLSPTALSVAWAGSAKIAGCAGTAGDAGDRMNCLAWLKPPHAGETLS
jgi:hypothetical protein